MRNKVLQFIYTDPQTPLEELLGGHFYINALGKIEAGDDKEFQKLLETARPPVRSTMYIDSTGGDVEAAMDIGRLIRDNWFSTSIGRYHLKSRVLDDPVVDRELVAGECLSAATLVYLGGRLRHFPNGSKFGVHQFSFKDPSPENLIRSQTLSARIASYISDMGVAPNFLEISSSTPSNEINLISASQLRQLNVVTDGATDVDWSVQARGGVLYVRGERDSIFGHHKVMLAYSKRAGFMYWAVIEAQGREEELTSLGLVEIVLNDEETRIDISDRCERVVAGIYVHILTNLTHDEARSIAFARSLGVHVRFCVDAPMFLGVTPMSTHGGREQLETLFNSLSVESELR